MLVKKNNRWSLHIPFEKNINLPDKDFIRPVLAVDLGLNHTATCSVVSANGTVLHREFIDYAREKDRLRRLLGQDGRISSNNMVNPQRSKVYQKTLEDSYCPYRGDSSPMLT